ncbi:MAG: hypothetical protein LBU94_02560 [Clostridiales bacterium]|jgi:hypothetical protein|nr:hypothetical protein [Clostridiales bacterium]
MADSLEDALKSDAFKNIEAEKIQAIRELSTKIQGKSIPEVLSIFNGYSHVFQNGNQISSNEREQMITVLLGVMDKENREKFVSAIKMVNMMKGIG